MHRLFRKAAIVFFGIAIPLNALPAFDPLPQTINYQGYLTNPGGTPLNNTVAMTFKLYSASTGGAPLYTEVQPAVLVSNGSFNTMIGVITPIPLPFDRPYWLGVSISADPEMTPRQPLSSTPYAFRAAAVDPESASLNQNYMRRGGNAFGETVVFGTTDNQALELRVNGVRAMRFEPAFNSANVIGGSVSNFVTTGAYGATIGGGGGDTTANANSVSDEWGTVGGGFYNRAGNSVGATFDASFATVGGGWVNLASGDSSTVAGGDRNTASGRHSIVPGGVGNIASGSSSFAAGSRAKSQTASGTPHSGAFVWADASSVLDFYSTAPNEFSARATGGVRFVTAVATDGNPTRTLRINPNAELDFGSTTRQMLNLWGPSSYGIGVQADTLYQRSNNDYAWYVGGTHNDAALTPGGTGFALMTLTNGSPAGLPAVSGLARAQTFTSTSDRAAKEAFERVDGIKVLAALVKMPLQSWKYRNEENVRHIGPTAQDFRAAFDVGYDDKTIATVDADGVAFAAIQGLNQLLGKKDAEIQAQNKRIKLLEDALTAIQSRLGMR